jgi:hypothetical protein
MGHLAASHPPSNECLHQQRPTWAAGTSGDVKIRPAFRRQRHYAFLQGFLAILHFQTHHSVDSSLNRHCCLGLWPRSNPKIKEHEPQHETSMNGKLLACPPGGLEGDHRIFPTLIQSCNDSIVLDVPSELGCLGQIAPRASRPQGNQFAGMHRTASPLYYRRCTKFDPSSMVIIP